MRQELEFERYCNNNSNTGINYEAAYDQLLQHSDRGDVTTTEDEEGEDGLSYRKVPIKDLINSFENQSRPVMRFKLADEQIIRKVYNKGEVVTSTSGHQDTSHEEQSVSSERRASQPEPLPDTDTDEQNKNDFRNCGGETTDDEQLQANYDSDACQGIR